MASQVKAGYIGNQHNEALKVVTQVKAGGYHSQHSRGSAAQHAGSRRRHRDAAQRESLQVRSQVKAGTRIGNHNETTRG